MREKNTIQRTDVLKKARDLAEDYGERLTLTVFQRETGVAQRVIYDLFGSWKSVRMEVGLGAEAPRLPNKVTREEILERMREVVGELGEDVTMRVFMNETGFSGRMIETRFGSWGALREAVGLSRRARIQPLYTDEEILEDLYRVYRIFRERPVYDKHKLRGGRISPGTICHRLGSWDWACRRLKDLLRDHGHFNPEMPLPEELEERIRLSREESW